MDRAELIKGLENLVLANLDVRPGYTVIREAIDLLRVPETAEIEAARRKVNRCGCGDPECAITVYAAILDHALDALARAPGLEAKLERERDNYEAQIRDLSGWLDAVKERLSRMQEATTRLREAWESWSNYKPDGKDDVRAIHVAQVAGDALRALADESTAQREERFWRVHPVSVVGSLDGYWRAFECDAKGVSSVHSDGSMIPLGPERRGMNHIARAEAEADGRASGLREWKP